MYFICLGGFCFHPKSIKDAQKIFEAEPILSSGVRMIRQEPLKVGNYNKEMFCCMHNNSENGPSYWIKANYGNCSNSHKINVHQKDCLEFCYFSSCLLSEYYKTNY